MKSTALWRTTLCLGLALFSGACEQLNADADGGSTGPDANISADGGGGDDAMVVPGECADLSAMACGERDDCVLHDGSCSDPADAPCEALGENQCAERDDCVAQLDAFDVFAACAVPGPDACIDLDQAACAEREDCEWQGDHCDTPAPPTCDERDTEEACAAGAGCHWWADACHDDPQPARCDQPDPASCEAAECEWTARGCMEPMPECADLPQVACGARQDCTWQGNACVVDPRTAPCEALDPVTCTMRNDCGWAADRCIEIDDGACDTLNEQSCQARADCVPEYIDHCGQEDGADGDRADPEPGEDPNGAPQDPPCRAFVGCADPAPLNCREIPIDACDPTPGCETYVVDDCPPPPGCEDGQPCPDVCGPELLGCREAALDCEALGVRACDITPGCALKEVEICDDGRRAAPGGDGDEFFPEPPPCRQELRCFPEDPQAGCANIQDPEQCDEQPGCHPRWDECAQGGDCDGEGCDGILPPECFVCAPDENAECEALGEALCAERPDCVVHEEEICACGGGELPNGLIVAICEDDADCPNGWACEDGICGGGGECPCQVDVSCRPARVENRCEDLPPDACVDHAECQLTEHEICACDDGDVAIIGGGCADDADCPEGMGCWDGVCAGEPGPCVCEPELVCEPRDEVNCWQVRDVDVCLEMPACEWHVCDCPAGAECDCADQCAPRREPGPCEDLDEARCEADAACGGFVDAAGEFVCRPLEAGCADMDPDACEAHPECGGAQFQICEGAELPCGEGQDCDLPAPPEGGCFDVWQCMPIEHACWSRHEDCEAVDNCIEIQVGDESGCIPSDHCEALPAEVCDAHPNCLFEAGEDGCFIGEDGVEICPGGEPACGCDIDDEGQEICWCEELPENPGRCVPAS